MPGTNTRTDETQQIAEYWNNIANEFDAIYTGNKNPVGRSLDRWLRRDIYQRFEWVMSQAGDGRGMKICDIGCGSGRFVASLAKRGAQVTGVDFAPEMLKLGAQLAEKEGVADRCKFVMSDVLDWKTDEQFDLVVAIGFWDYVADPLPRLRVIRRLTKTTFLSAWPRAATLRAAIRKVRLKVDGCPVYFFTLPQVEDYLQRAGFRVESREILGQLYCVRSTAI
ncbi:MAG TPA: methyltransferase domain-containing protein [Candidatus Eremiobacteraceae bacterium]|nr:methyltransferase domain-containing protein [Candidatus Eremiobacteraceae bacterium]